MSPKSNRLAAVRVVIILISFSFAGCGTSIHDEVSRGNIDRVQKMLERSPELLESQDGMKKTPLFFAVARGRKDLISLLLQRGANVRAQDITGLTPLHIAAWWDKKEEAELLLEAGGDLEATDVFGDTPLHTAAIQGRTRMVEFLLSKGANVTARNVEGKTPLDVARFYHKDEVAKLLEERLSDESKRDSGTP